MEMNTGIKKGDLKENEPISVDFNGKKLAIVLSGGEANVLEGTCPHEGGTLGEGYVDGTELICPLHAGAFQLATGKANENTPWVTDIKRYAAKLNEAGEIVILE